MVNIPTIKMVMTGGWFMKLFYPHLPSRKLTLLWKMDENCLFIVDLPQFTYEKQWFSIAMLLYQRVFSRWFLSKTPSFRRSPMSLSIRTASLDTDLTSHVGWVRTHGDPLSLHSKMTGLYGCSMMFISQKGLPSGYLT